MNVHWTKTAEGHLDAIFAYISQDSPEYAIRTVDRLTRRSQQIANFPFRVAKYLSLRGTAFERSLVSVYTIHRWIRKRSLSAHKVGHLWEFNVPEVDAWVRARKAAEEFGFAQEQPQRGYRGQGERDHDTARHRDSAGKD